MSWRGLRGLRDSDHHTDWVCHGGVRHLGVVRDQGKQIKRPVWVTRVTQENGHVARLVSGQSS